ncbi:MAG: winged helix DNA-binding protein [Deltaproteobacteria bacterium]|nr:winged helix DNA-binding protein [Deltaproteobacteria bacterium]MBV8454695.1 winged helix DNA-binding protein [Deltaproteobacteria bacterium]
MAAKRRKTISSETRITELLELFYPVHYKACIALEDDMTSGQLTRMQTAIMWLIRSEGREGRLMRRKDIERLLQTWFEVSSSAVTKALRKMARPPLSLLELVEDPSSGREKLVSLTPKGEKFLQGMVIQGHKFIRHIVERLTEAEVNGGIRYLRRAVAIIDELQASHRKKQQHNKLSAVAPRTSNPVSRMPDNGRYHVEA